MPVSVVVLTILNDSNLYEPAPHCAVKVGINPRHVIRVVPSVNHGVAFAYLVMTPAHEAIDKKALYDTVAVREGFDEVVEKLNGVGD
jgi:hypothetical protein